MASMIPAAAGLGQSWAQNPNLSYGGNQEHSDFSHLDPVGNWITKVGGDPLNLYGNKNNPNALLFPSSNPNAGGVPSILPNLGAASMTPQMPQGSFQHFNPGPGPYNQMAAQSIGGMMFNPGVHQNTPIGAPGAKGGMMQQPINSMPMMVRNNQGKVRY